MSVVKLIEAHVEPSAPEEAEQDGKSGDDAGAREASKEGGDDANSGDSNGGGANDDEDEYFDEDDASDVDEAGFSLPCNL